MIQLVLFAQFIDTENGDDVLQIAIALQHRLHLAGDAGVLFADDVGTERAGRRCQRIDGGINALRRDRSLEINERVQVRECIRRRGVGRIVGRHVNGLHGRDRALLRRRDALLKLAHFRRQRRLITDGAGHTPEECRHFGAGLRESENVVDEQERVRAGFIAEIFSHRERAQCHAKTRSGWLIHLAEDHHGLIDNVLAGVADLGFLHFQPEVGSFARAFADAGEDRGNRRVAAHEYAR